MSNKTKYIVVTAPRTGTHRAVFEVNTLSGNRVAVVDHLNKVDTAIAEYERTA